MCLESEEIGTFALAGETEEVRKYKRTKRKRKYLVHLSAQPRSVGQSQKRLRTAKKKVKT